MKINCERILVIIGALAIIALAIGLPFISKPSEELLPNFSLAQLAFSAVAFFIIFITLYFTIIQFRKLMAKPKLKVVFSEDGKAKTIINATRDKKKSHQLRLSILNSGNAITKLFQVEFEIPIILNPSFSMYVVNTQPPYIPPRPSSNEKNRILPLCNDNNYCVFINSPCEFHTLTLRTDPSKYDEYSNEYNLKYKIFGDWSEVQEGTLKVKINKQ
jgi:hypothetical protein